MRGHNPVWISLVEDTKPTDMSEVLDHDSANWNNFYETMEHLCYQNAIKDENVNSSHLLKEPKVSLSTATNLHITRK